MRLMKQIWAKAKTDKKKIVLAEGEEERNIKASEKIVKNGLADITMIGNQDVIKEKAKKLGVDLTGVEIDNPETSDYFKIYANEFFQLRKKKGMTLEKATKIVRDPLYFATMMVKVGAVDGLVSGSIHTTGDLLRPGLQIVKTAPGTSVVSSIFMMEIPNCDYGDKGFLLFADCAVNPNPSTEQLAAIAVSTAETAKELCGMDPKIAMLSFSSKGSAQHDTVDKVRNATELAKKLNPELKIDGELQLDASIVPEVANLKAPGSPVAGKANVLIFPELQSGNIGYKLVQRFAHAEAIGPICQGFARPINDLSRGCSSDDIVNVVAVTAVQAQAIEN